MQKMDLVRRNQRLRRLCVAVIRYHHAIFSLIMDTTSRDLPNYAIVYR